MVPRKRRGRLFQKYLLLILTLVTGALLASGAISIYFTYQENKDALSTLQHEKALSAAAIIEQYIRHIEQQLAYAALPQLGAGDVELRRVEFGKLLRQVPEVTDIAQLDPSGREQIAVSRLGMDSVNSGKDRSNEPAFLNARRGQTWFSPVYFKKETEPYMTIAIRSGGDKGPVTLAEVNLKFVWDVVSRIKIGDKGKAYVVDNRGFLVADPDIGLVLRKTDLSPLTHVAAAIGASKSAGPTMVSRDLAQNEVLTSVAPIDSLHWYVFAEQPVSEVYAKLNASILRNGMLLLAGMVISALVALALARGMVRPIRTLSEGTQRIGAGELDQKIDIKTGDELETLADRFNQMTAQLRESYAGLERKVDERTRELSNALDQQTAISDILRVISSSPTDVEPVLDAVANRAANLCSAPFARIMLIDGGSLRPVSEYWKGALSREHGAQGTEAVPLDRTSILGRACTDRAIVHIDDVMPLVDSEFPGAKPNMLRFSVRAVLGVPLMRENEPYGGIFLARHTPGFFAPDQVALVQTFAQQAAIAIDNVRLFNETKEALAQQTAISEILRVISSSPTDVQPVLDAVAKRAALLCDAPYARVLLADGDLLRLASEYVVDGQPLPQINQEVPFSRASVAGRAAVDRETVHYADIVPLLDSEYRTVREIHEDIGARAVLAVPLGREGGTYGAIFLFRREPRPFPADQIALVETFARQAAIAIDNVRLFNETKEALAQQTAISEILRVISSSPTDVQPVLDAVAERAAHLCDAPFARVMLIEGDILRRATDYSLLGDALKPPPNPIPLKRSVLTGRAALDRVSVHHADIVPLLDIEYPDSKESISPLGARAVLSVPLVREGGAYGGIFLFRREPKPFSPKQIALVETFARQAAIAIDNVRLFNETNEALAQQTAISEILRVISSSPGDVKPMLSAVAERSRTLCDAEQATIVLVEGSVLRSVAASGHTRTLAEGETMPLSRGSVAGRAVTDGISVQIEDLALASEEEYPVGRELQRRIGHHTALAVPLMRDEHAIGAIQLWRMETRSFTNKQVALVKTFADQAAIAIENVRLFNETKEGLAQQTAIAEILRVISGSPTDVQPVLDAICERAARLCDAASASMYLTEGGMLRHLAVQGPFAEPMKHMEPFPINRETISGRALLERRTMHIPDMLAEASGLPLSAEFSKRYGHRTVVVVPLFREGRPFGTILLRRLEVRPFTEREIALLQTFGDQAAIALENVRLFNETKEALEQQRASGEVLAAISSSIADTKPVFEKIVASCERLFAGKLVGITLVAEDGTLALGAYHGPKRQTFERMIAGRRADDSTATGRAIQSRAVQHYPDLDRPDVPALARATWIEVGMKAAITAPMLWEGKALGAIWVVRDYAGRFSDKEIGLLKTFADQAVIAIQNVRLFNETKEALEQQRASGEVLSAISSSIADTKPVFEKILESCEHLFAGNVIAIERVDDTGVIHVEAYRGPAPGEKVRIIGPVRAGASISANAMLSGTLQHIPDFATQDGLPAFSREAYATVGVRAAMVAPMLWESRGIGAVSVGRDHPGPFSDKDMALLKTFADQAVIAIQNARLFNETNEALEQQRASGEVLAAISSSIADTSPVFDKILVSCEQLFGGKVAGVNLVGDDGLIRLRAYHGPNREGLERMFPLALNGESGSGIAITTRSIVHYPDVMHTDVPSNTRKACTAVGYRGVVFAPMVWEGKGIGVIFVGRDYAGPFSEKEIALLKTFADQAAIAIQNARLFNETNEALEQQRASAEVLAAVSSSIADTKPVFDKIIESCARLFAGTVITINVIGEDGLVRPAAHFGPAREQFMKMVGDGFRLDDPAFGSALSIRSGQVVHYPDTEDASVPEGTRRSTRIVGTRSTIFAPMLWEGRGIGAIAVGRQQGGPFSEREIALLRTFADQAVIAIQNARLFREIQDKGRELEVANKHKSEFLANMSHELRTPLNAIIGFSEVLLERLFGDLNDKQADYLQDIHASGKHLLTLINDILDLSKIEAGRMELEPSTFELESAVSNAMTLVRERAQQHGILLGHQVDKRLGEIVADERKFKQILINLLSNAVKFTPDGGRIDVTARREDGAAIIAVHDTGIGIAAADQGAVFEEFRQVGRDYTRKQEGTGLGLALTRKFVELHGGRIWVESELGKGSTFTFTIPLRQ